MCLISDPGSDLMSHVVVKVNQWFGIDKLVSLVDRHQSNGVEPTNKSILRHLGALLSWSPGDPCRRTHHRLDMSRYSSLVKDYLDNERHPVTN